jgi:hypothetical protein
MTPAAPRRWALVASILVGVLGPQWWLVPETSPLDPSAAVVAGSVLIGLAGVATALALGQRLGTVARRLTTVAAGGQVLVLGWVVLEIAADLVGADNPDRVGTHLLYILGALSVGALWLSLAAGVSRLTPVVATEGTRHAHGV